MALGALGYGPESAGRAAGERTPACVPPAGRVAGLPGFVRVANHSDEPATAEITACDDDGRRFGPAVLALPASSAVT